jgi:hypothetical protein
MIKRTLLVWSVVGAVMLGCAPRADAALDDWWDYLDQLSGPGPFHDGPAIGATVGCWEDGQFVWRRAIKRTRFNPCVYWDWRELSAPPKGPFAEVSANLVDSGVSFQLSPYFDYGVGIGWAHFATTVRETDYSVNNFTLTPARLVFRPLRAFPKFRSNAKAGFLQIVLRDTVRFGRLTSADFGAPSDRWTTGTEHLKGATLVIDVLTALRGDQ